MRRKPLLFFVVLVLVLAAAAATVRIQRPGQARVIRRGDSLNFINRRMGMALPAGASCLVPSAGDALRFRESYDLDDALGETIGVDVTFDYAAPANVPAGWPAGDWCTTLRSQIASRVQQWLVRESTDALRSDPRGSGDRAAAMLQPILAAWNLSSRLVAVRIRTSEAARAALPVPDVASKAQKAPPVIFIGLDGADWELLDRYIDAGAMPNLASLVREGTSGNLLTQHPPLSPLIWTSMMTGTSPLEHEILDFTRFSPKSGVKEPITSDERKVPAIWNMATQAGKSSATFGLWATYPAEAVRGLLVSDRLFTFLFSEKAPPPGVVYPQSRDAWARAILQRTEKEVTYETLTAYLPWLTREEYDERTKKTDPYSHPVSALRRMLVETGVYDGLARDYLSTRTPDLTVLYFQGTDSVGHMFAPYTAPRQPNISEEDFNRYSRVPELYFRHIDEILGRYKALAKARGARIVIASDHGFHWIEGRPTELSSFAAATAAKWHRNQGVYLLWGAGIPASRSRSDTNEPHVAQLCATLLALGGMPRAAGAGEPFGPVAASGQEVDYRRWYTPARPVIADEAAAGNAEELAKLKALGYIGSGESTSAPAALAGRSTHTAGWHNNRALILRNDKKLDAAQKEYEEAIAVDPNLSSALWNLSDLLHTENRDLDRADALLVKAVTKGLPEGRSFLIGRAIGYQRKGLAPRSLKLLEEAVAAMPDDIELRLFRGRYRIDQRDCRGALADFDAAIRLAPENPVPYASAGVAAICLGDHEAAQRYFARSLQIDPNQPKLRDFLRNAR